MSDSPSPGPSSTRVSPLVQCAALYLLCALYALLRYVAFMPENRANLPVFVLNKAVAMGAALCFVLAFWLQWRRRLGRAQGQDPALWFRAGLAGVVVHIPMALTILSPAYFEEFFAGDRFSFNGEAVVMFGAFAAAGVFLLTRPAWSPDQRWALSLATMGLLLGHTLAMGLARGLNVTRSHGYLPPMWLLSLLGIALGLGFVLMSRPDKSDRPPG